MPGYQEKQLLVTQNKRHHEREEESIHRQISTCTACCGKTHLGSIWGCMIKGFQITEGTQDLIAAFLFLFFLLIWLLYHAVHWPVFLSEIQKELYNISLPPPSAELIQKVNNKKDSWAIWPPCHLFHFHYLFYHSELALQFLGSQIYIQLWMQL